MKKLSVFLLLAVFSMVTSLTQAGQHQDQTSHPSCSYCGMDRVKFGHSRMLVEYEDGGEVGTCSIHCMALEFANAIDRVPRHLFVADYRTGELVTAEKAIWVLGGDKQGVMTSRAKWAFAQQSDADAFIAGHGGTIADFDQAMKASYEDMYQDTQRIRKMRAMKKMKMKKK
ncbi:nitrous oxide reductase accessory protein NosL [uncultured Desulfuromusa sp.]|uniref:nitrous oxide reductase accessory protein NosL n=1 Tax=uncultured Desulfuromusa sp. TaxID=219183 RepID=UPI002AA6A329|nr:nitrous oxide reductase accessory protein NosL [uncultured Desulfuromusa sp.]